MYNSPRQTQYDSTLQQNLAAVEAARREHLRVLRNAQRAREILDAENERLRQLEELQTQEDLRRIAEERVEIARAQEELAQAELQARQRAEEIERRPTPQPPPIPKQVEQPQPPPTPTPESQQPTPAPPLQPPTPQVQAPTPQPQPKPPPAAQQTDTPVTATPTTPATPRNPHEAEHQRFLSLHQRLKHLRSSVTTQSKGPAGAAPIASTYSDLKISTLGDLRRELKKRVTQLTTDTSQNMLAITATRSLLTKARRMTNVPTVDASQFLISHPAPPGTDTAVSALFLFLLSIFAKSIVKKLALEASESHLTAEPVGIAAITIFANPDLRLDGSSFIDILLAKYHKVCPVLFGSTGSERTERGRERLGWAKEDGVWIKEALHFERMTGLAAGWGALCLRDFSKARSSNPLPAHHYWMAVVRILNLRDVQRTHCVVVKALVELHVGKFVGVYGAAAIAVLGVAVREFPQKVRETSSESEALSASRTAIEQRWRLVL